MDPLAEARQRMRNHSDVRLREDENRLEAWPTGTGGFPVVLEVDPDGGAQRYTVHYAGWYEAFESPRDALNCFSYGLRGQCRLRVTYRGTVACRWTLEHGRDGQWRAESSRGRLWIPFWKKKRTEYLANTP